MDKFTHIEMLKWNKNCIAHEIQIHNLKPNQTELFLERFVFRLFSRFISAILKIISIILVHGEYSCSFFYMLI